MPHVQPPPPSRRRARRAVEIAVATALIAGCAAGPDDVRPVAPAPAAYKEAGPWKTAEPRAIDARHPWWTLYDDPVLDDLMAQANRANQTLQAAEAQYRQATALVAQARAAYFPTVQAQAGVSRARTNTASTGPQTGNTFDVGLVASWEPDLWGSVRRSVEAGTANAAASADDLAAARLSVQAALAQDYLQLRVTDLQHDLYAATTAAYASALKLTQSQYAAGVALRSDVALAASQLKAAQAQEVDLEATRAQLEHAIATLCGKAPAEFSLAAQPLTVAQLQSHLPATPPGLPSTLLERRPDIAAAERRAAAANANIGVAQAAFYPALTLSASPGLTASNLAQLVNAPTRVWSLGAALAQTLFDGGLRRSRTDQAVAAYDTAVAQYRQTVLDGFQQVEDNLAALRVLDQEAGLQDEAVQASQLAERSALSQYRAGTATYLAVVTAQTLSLGNQRTATQIVGRQLAASVLLVTATGGGWHGGDARVSTLSSSQTASP